MAIWIGVVSREAIQTTNEATMAAIPSQVSHFWIVLVTRAIGIPSEGNAICHRLCHLRMEQTSHPIDGGLLASQFFLQLEVNIGQ